MGCDIHWVLERKYGERWVGVSTDYQETPTVFANLVRRSSVGQRNYAFFAMLAGVRGFGPDPIGLPDDASDYTRALADDWSGDGHSHSWTTLEDFCLKRECSESEDATAELMRAKIQGESSNLSGKYFSNIDQRADYRVVFWFDN